MAVFDGVRYLLSPSLSPTRRNELASVLDLNGAVPHVPYTHLILLPASHAHHDATNDPTVKLVTDRWVDRSVVLGKCQPEQYYSPNPAMIFSGVVACATDLPAPDLEVLSAGVTALGGQWRTGLTRDVTHLFALRPGSDKYNTAIHFGPQTHMCIVTPHWFEDAVRLGRRIPETPYAWPDPQVLRPGMSLDVDDDALATEGKRKRRVLEAGDGTDIPNEVEHVRVWDGRRILLSATLELAESSRGAIEAGIRRAGGVVISIPEDADEDAEEKAVDECDVFITRWRSGKSYFKAARAALLIGTLSWLFSVESSGTLHSPLDSLLWYPTPRGGIPGLSDCEISVTNYTGTARDYLKRLIGLVGAKFTPSMSQSNKVLIAGFQPSPKTTRALSWSIPVVNHTWLEDCFVEWRALTVGLERYIVYPPGIDFGKMLMTRHNEPPSSQPVSIPRLSGGAVPGGRGVGIIDLGQEQIRNAGYRARTSEGGGPFDLSTTHENEATADDVRPPSRAGSVKKTPSSARAKRVSISMAMETPTTMGAFVDHVIEIPTDDDDKGGRRTSGSGKQRGRTPVLGPRANATPRSVSRGSSAGLFSSGGEVEVVVRHLPGSSKKGKEKDKDKDKGKESEGEGHVGKRQAGTANEAEVDKNEDAQPVGPPKPRPRLLRQISDVETGDEAEGRALVQTSKSRRRAVNGTILDFGSDLQSGGEMSEASVPPRRPTGTGATTPVKSGMKPRPKAKSTSDPTSVPGGESDDEIRVMGAGPATAAGSEKLRNQMVKPTGNGDVISKEKGKERDKEKEKATGGKKQKETQRDKGKEKMTERKRKETERTTFRPRLLTQSPTPTSPEATNPRAPKRRLSVLVPPAPKDYFSSQGEGDRERGGEKGTDVGAGTGTTSAPGRKQLTPAGSILAVSAETSTSTGKRGKPHPVKSSTGHAVAREPGSEPQPKPKPKPAVSKAHTRDEEADMENREAGNDSSMIIDIPVISSRSGARRSAANKASTRLREEVMPDVISFEMEQKKAKRRRSGDWESVTSVREGGLREEKERAGKRRKVPREEEEEAVEEAEVEEVVIAPLVKAKPTLMNGKGKTKEGIAAGSNGSEDMDDAPAKSKPSGSVEKKGGRGRGKELAAVRVMTTSVTLSDDVVKRLTKLGVQMTTKPTDCTHLIAKGIVRTEKFLCAMSVSPHVLTEEWAITSAKAGKLLPEHDYLLSDAAAEQKWGFKFADALARAKGPQGGSNLFKGMTFYVTSKVGVDAKLFRNVVSTGGGQVQTSTPPTVRILKGKANRYVVSCQEDKGIWRPLVEEGFRVYSPELVLRGALRQEIEWEREECLVAG